MPLDRQGPFITKLSVANMNIDEFEKEYKNIKKQHSVVCWVHLIIGFCFSVFGFYLIGDPKLGYIGKYSVGNALAPLGGVIVGYTLSYWKGGKSYKLIEKMLLKAKDNES